MNITEKSERTLAIGEVAKLTGLSVHTLRIWEHRYGFSSHLEKERGKHRRYNTDEIKRLKLIKQSLDIGLKPSEIVNYTIPELQSKVEEYSVRQGLPVMVHPLQIIEKWINLVKTWNDKELMKEFAIEWAALGPIGFVEDRCSHFVKEVGDLWAIGSIDVSQEHFATELLQSFLDKKWKALGEGRSVESDEKFVLATLPGETHILGLHMVATVLAAAGKKVIFLGGPTPEADVARSARENNASGVCVSICESSVSPTTLAHMEKLRKDLKQGVHLIAGGCGAPSGLSFVKTFSSLRSFYDWIRLNIS